MEGLKGGEENLLISSSLLFLPRGDRNSPGTSLGPALRSIMSRPKVSSLLTRGDRVSACLCDTDDSPGGKLDRTVECRNENYSVESNLVPCGALPDHGADPSECMSRCRGDGYRWPTVVQFLSQFSQPITIFNPACLHFPPPGCLR